MSYHTAHPGPNPLQETPQQYGHHQQQLPHQPQYHHDAQYTVNTLPPQQAAVYGVPQYTPVQTTPADPSAYQVSPLSHGHHSQRRASERNAPDRGEVSGGAGFFTQLCATIRRQLIQKRRMWGSFLLEVLLPALFMLGLLVISSVSGRTEYPPQSFTNVAGPLPMGEIIRQQMLCYNSTNPATQDDLKALLSPCDPSNYHICLPTSEEIPIEGFCLNSTWEAAMGQAVRFLNVEMDVEIPNYDEYVLWKWFAVTVIPAEDSIFADRLNQARQPGKIFVAPDNSITRSFTSYMNTTHRLFKHTFGGYFASRDDAMPFVKSISSEGKIWGLYEILADSPSYLKYSISMNTSAMNMLQSSRNEQAVGLGEKNYARYTVSGALTLQKTINDYHSINTVGSSDSDIFATGARSHLSITPMPLDDYVKDEFLMIAGQMAPFLLVLSFLYSVSQLAKRLVEEKEQRLREGTMIMGLSKSAFFSSWLLVYYVQMFITSLIMTIIAKAGITKQSNFFIIFFAFFLYSVATVNMAALLSTFFNKSKIAALLVPLLYFVFAIPAFTIPQTAGSGPFLSLSFLCPMPFSVSLNLIFTHEINNGLGWNMAGSTKDKPYNFGLCLFWFIFDFFLYGFLLVYFDNVLPKDWGTTLHPCYCCCCSCVKRDKVNKASNLQRQDLDAIDNPRNHLTHATTFGVLQDYPLTNRHSTVHINQLRKEFPGAHGKVNVAVNGMELRMFPDSITVFLGHNGAGKTTVMNMMTGMMSPTDGDVTIYGKSILTDMQEIRRDIGFCPQHNILWADLTCMEHLQYFARLKGYSGAEVDEEAIEMLRKVDLLDKKDVFSKNLSGGQKRKLSVAIAFMGKARLVLLDEPTAGMDVAARRHTWDVLKEMSKGRTILLTTHFMDEADLLGSRIAIMSKGTLHSYGTPMYLKNNLGSGYVMKVACTVPIADPMPILREIQRILPGASLKEAKGQELAIVLPKEGARSFPAAIRALDSAHCKRAYNISSVSVSVSSLEDVFLAIAEHEEMEGKSQQELDEEHATVHSAFDALETVYTRLQQKHRAAAAGGQEDIEMGSATNNTKIPTMGATGSFGRQLRGMIMKRVNHGRRDYCALCLQIVAPLICILIAMALGEIGAPSPQRVYWDNEGLYKNDVDQTTATNNCPAINDYFDSDFVFVDRQALNSTPAFSGYLLDQFDNNGDRERMVSFSCNDTFGNNVLFSNVTGLASAPQALNQFYRAKLRAHTGNPGATIDAAQWPFPFTEREMSQIDTISAVLVALFILIPFTFIPSTYVAFIVRERECKSKHLQFVSGASYVAYWLANFIFDLVSYLVTVGIAFLIFGIFNQKWTIGTVDTGFGTFVLFIFYGLSAIGCAYLASFLFDNHSTAQTIIMMVNFIIGFLLVLLMFFLREIDSTADAAEVIRYFLLFIPPFALGDGLFALVMSSALSEVQGTKSAFSTEVAGWNMIYMALLSVVFLAITMFIDHPSRQKRREMLSFKATHTAPEVNDEDEDVARERAEVEKGQRLDDVVQVQGLRKEFDLGGGKQKVAVQNITFGVKAGEVFGFLGTNGAGKTTTMSMLTTEILPTCGHGRIGGYDIVQDSGNTRRLIGYCPQFDAIMDLLTPAEHLNLFAALRGVDETEEVVEALIKSCALEKYRDIPAGQLSGGNKRKLSVAMSLIGGPSIVFLDEPSAGMDPHARRQLWDVIIFVAKHSSVVLTTHHLEEVDVLAHRVGIMDAGLLKCLGSLEHLKLKFGSGFELTIQVSESGFKSATEFIANTYPSAVLVEARQQRILYTLPFDSTDLASLFETIQRATDDPSIGIVDYTVQQTSLEQVFMRISEMSDADNEHTSPAAALQEGTASVPITDSVNNRQHSAHAYTDSVFNRSSRNRRAQSVDVNNQTL